VTPVTGTSAEPFVPTDHAGIGALRRAAAACRGCSLYERATQTVFGAGSGRPRVVLVGEQPGDQEDRQGQPFVGPSGRLLHEAMGEAGIPAGQAYLTNAVKHFKWEPRGNLRLHKKPTAREVAACVPWLRAELDVLHPEVVVALGATAAQALLGPNFRVSRSWGEVQRGPWGTTVVATVHPSSVLRAPDHDERAAERARFVSDLRSVARLLG